MTYNTKPGFVRVFIPARNKYTRIRSQHANNPNYLIRNGMVVVPVPVAPPMPVTVQDEPTTPVTIQDKYPGTPTIMADEVVVATDPVETAPTPAKPKPANKSKTKSTK
jgi:hypothetical protein